MGRDEPPVTVSPALDEARVNRATVRRASVDLERALAAPARAEPAHWGAEVGTATAAMSEAFTRHVRATEAPNGLLSEMVELSPRLAHSAELLRKDHQLIAAQIDRLAAAAADVVASVRVDEIRGQALDLLRHISEHRHLGVEIVHEAYCVDIEAAD